MDEHINEQSAGGECNIDKSKELDRTGKIIFPVCNFGHNFHRSWQIIKYTCLKSLSEQL